MYFLDKENKYYCRQQMSNLKYKDFKQFVKVDLDKNVLFYLYYQLRDHPKRYKKSGKKFVFVKKQIEKVCDQYMEADSILCDVITDYRNAIAYAKDTDGFNMEKLHKLEIAYEQVEQCYKVLDEEIQEFFVILNEYEDKTYEQYYVEEQSWIEEIE